MNGGANMLLSQAVNAAGATSAEKSALLFFVTHIFGPVPDPWKTPVHGLRKAIEDEAWDSQKPFTKRAWERRKSEALSVIDRAIASRRLERDKETDFWKMAYCAALVGAVAAKRKEPDQWAIIEANAAVEALRNRVGG